MSRLGCGWCRLDYGTMGCCSHCEITCCLNERLRSEENQNLVVKATSKARADPGWREAAEAPPSSLACPPLASLLPPLTGLRGLMYSE